MRVVNPMGRKIDTSVEANNIARIWEDTNFYIP